MLHVHMPHVTHIFITCLSTAYIQGASDKRFEGGCTATVAVVQGTTLCVANVGDSQAVLGMEKESGQHSGRIITTRHWGQHEQEAERIRSKHGESVRLLKDGYVQARLVRGG